jgi:outer membrane protein assembly factor BamD (BamD/ComL family)
MMVAEYYAKMRRWHGALWRLQYLQQNFPEYQDMERVTSMIAEMEANIEALQLEFEKRNPQANPPSVDGANTVE